MMTYINDLSEKFTHKKTATTKNGKTRVFFSVSLPCPKSTTGYGSITINPQDCIKSRTPGYRNIRLGETDKTRTINIFNGEANRYEDITVTNGELLSYVKAARSAATAKHKAAVKTTA